MTPDTEWEKEFDKEFNELLSEAGYSNGEETYDVETPRVKAFITQLLTSRDTYWKERVRKIIKEKITHNAQYLKKPPHDGETNFQTKRRRANNNYIKGQEQACDDLLQALDNLK